MGLFDKKAAETIPQEVAECNTHMAELEQQKKKVIFQIGLKYVESNTLKDVKDTPYEEDLNELESIEKDMEKTEKRKLAVQGLRKCEKCGNILVIDSVFCNKCGERLEELQAEVMENICPKCGAAYEEGAVFCISCGNKLV